jgi:arylsulfatase A-like enzyme
MYVDAYVMSPGPEEQRECQKGRGALISSRAMRALNPPWKSRSVALGLLAALALGIAPTAHAASRGPRFPNVIVVCIDTLRVDRLSGFGYRRPTTPTIDRLLARGARFTRARTVEPLTGPASASMLTSRFPHEHGASRNGLRVRPGTESMPKLLSQRGYRTAAFVGNWTLRDKLIGLSEHFDTYGEVFSRKRWLGMFNAEATGEDLTAEAVDWVREQRDEHPHDPYFMWLQYVEPHAPYRLWEEFTDRLGIDVEKGASKSDRYDTEVAYVDREVGRLLEALGGSATAPPDDTLVIFLADHGESLGDHDYWGHGRHVFDDTLRIPMGVVWPGRVPEGTIDAPALIIDVAPTVLGLLGLPAPDSFRGFDWSGVFAGGEQPPNRVTYYQAHKGAVHGNHQSSSARVEGLLQIGRVAGDRKEVYDVTSQAVRIYDLVSDPGELVDLAEPGTKPSEPLRIWFRTVRDGLKAASDIPPSEIDAESEEQLRALGYLD